MSVDKLLPTDPDKTMVVREVVPGVTTLATPFLRFGRIKFGAKATIGISPPSYPLP
jgi:hypothetical protein